MLLVKRRKLGRHPRFGVNAVGNAGDRDLVHRHTCPDIFPKRSTDFAVQFAHAVGVPAQAQRENGHAERVVWIDPRLAE